jgi:hypothetical protein
MTKKIKQPTEEIQRELQSEIHDDSDYALVRRKHYRIKWLKGGTRDKITNVILEEGNDIKQSCQCAALMVLNGFWAIKFRYWFLWRWFYYVRQYGEEELTDLLALGKKKVPQEQYYTNTILLTALKDTSMMMKKTEVASFLQEQHTGQPTK